MRRWRRPATDFPERRHTDALARMFERERERVRAEDEAFWREITEGSEP